jgi:hypothetical protein
MYVIDQHQCWVYRCPQDQWCHSRQRRFQTLTLLTLSHITARTRSIVSMRSTVVDLGVWSGVVVLFTSNMITSYWELPGCVWWNVCLHFWNGIRTERSAVHICTFVHVCLSFVGSMSLRWRPKIGSSIGIECVIVSCLPCFAKYEITPSQHRKNNTNVHWESTEHLRSARAVFHARNRFVCAPLCFALLRTDGHAGENVRDRFYLLSSIRPGLLRFRGFQVRDVWIRASGKVGSWDALFDCTNLFSRHAVI